MLGWKRTDPGAAMRPLQTVRNPVSRSSSTSPIAPFKPPWRLVQRHIPTIDTLFYNTMTSSLHPRWRGSRASMEHLHVVIADLGLVPLVSGGLILHSRRHCLPEPNRERTMNVSLCLRSPEMVRSRMIQVARRPAETLLLQRQRLERARGTRVWPSAEC